MAWTHDVRPTVLTEWGRDYHNKVRTQGLNQEEPNEVRPSCILETGLEIEED